MNFDDILVFSYTSLYNFGWQRYDDYAAYIKQELTQYKDLAWRYHARRMRLGNKVTTLRILIHIYIKALYLFVMQSFDSLSRRPAR